MLRTNKRVGDYQLGKTIGLGSFGKVKFAANIHTKERFAIKILEKSRITAQKMGNQIKKEILIMKKIAHPHVLASKTKIFMVLELVDGGELFDRLVVTGKFDEETSCKYFRQLISGMGYIHKQGVSHRDLKPENLLLDSKDNLKISDFGLSAMNFDKNGEKVIFQTTCGTPNYVAPEVLLKDGYDGEKADIWSLGVILYVLLAGFLPFDEPTMPSLFRKIVKAEYLCPKHFSEEAKNLLSIILCSDPRKRATMSDIISHPWVQGVDGFQLSSEESIHIINLLPEDNDKMKTSAIPIQGSHWSIQSNQKDHSISYSPSASPQASPPSTPKSYQPSPCTSQPGTPTLPPHLRPQSPCIDDIDSDSDDEEANGPIRITAFDLIHMVGGAALNNMFQKKNVKTYSQIQYTFNSKPVDYVFLLKLISQVLKENNCKHIFCEAAAKVKGINGNSPKTFQFTIQLYSLTENSFLIDFKKTKGDIFQYYEFLKIIHEKIQEALKNFSDNSSIDITSLPIEEEKQEEFKTLLPPTTF